MSLQPSVPKLTGMAAACLSCVVVFVWVAVVLGDFFAGLAATVAATFFFIGVCVSLWRLVMWRPVLRADARGIDVQVIATGLRHFDWEDIAALVTYAQPLKLFVSLPPQRFLGIKLHDSLAFQTQLAPLARSLVEHNKIADIWVSSVVFRGTAEAALSALERDFADEIASHQIAIQRIDMSLDHRTEKRPRR